MGTMSSSWRSLVSTAELNISKKILKRIENALKIAFDKNPDPRALTAVEIAPIAKMCDGLTFSDFHLEMPKKKEIDEQFQDLNIVKYQHIWEDEMFSMGIFIIPPGKSIPLHDHPGMSVISRVLYGSLHVKAMDFVSEEQQKELAKTLGFKEDEELLLARVCTDEKVEAPFTSELLPDHGNIHEFVADDEVGCAIFDILTPPYDLNMGRDCTYYRVVEEKKTSTTNEDRIVSLEEFEPTNFDVMTIPYQGPSL